MTGRVGLAVLGDPLAYTLSPDLHRAGLAALGLPGDSAALRTPVAGLAARLRELAAAGIVGVNLTHPLKHAVIGHLDTIADRAARAGSVNTVRFDGDRLHGDTTDGAGFVDWFGVLGHGLRGMRVVIMGAGGAARSLAPALLDAGAEVTVAARRPDPAAWAPLAPARLLAWPSPGLEAALESAGLVVNATPESAADRPVAPGRLRAGTRFADLTYGPGPTPWVLAALGAGFEAHDGLGMLIGQARRSFGVWFGREPAFDGLGAAVGWPR